MIGSRAAAARLALALAARQQRAPTPTAGHDPGAADFEPPVHDTPRSDDARLSIQWIGHATMLVQMDDKWILTDPFLIDRMAAHPGSPGRPRAHGEQMPAIDAVLISHMHPDHLSLGSLGRIQRKVSRLFVPQGGPRLHSQLLVRCA